MASYEIERYINNEIVAKTKATIDDDDDDNDERLPLSASVVADPTNTNSTLCSIL